MDELRDEFEKTLANKPLINKLHTLEKLLYDHTHYVENVMSMLEDEYNEGQKAEKLCILFDQEKDKIFASSISYA